MSGKHYAKLVEVTECIEHERLPCRWIARDSAGRLFGGDTREEAIAMLQTYNSPKSGQLPANPGR